MKYPKYLQKPLLYIIIGLIVLIPFILYFLKFKGLSIKVNDYFPGDEEKWAQFGDYIGGILNSILTTFLLFFSIWSFYRSQKESRTISEKANEISQTANKLSEQAIFLSGKANYENMTLAKNLQKRAEKLQIMQVRPYPTVNISYSNSEFYFGLTNQGLGILIVKSIKFEKDGIEEPLIRRFIKSLVRNNSHLIKITEYNLDDENKMVISPNGTYSLLEVFDPVDRMIFDQHRLVLLNQLYKKLNGMVINLTFTDIYGTIYDYKNTLKFSGVVKM